MLPILKVYSCTRVVIHHYQIFIIYVHFVDGIESQLVWLDFCCIYVYVHKKTLNLMLFWCHASGNLLILWLCFSAMLKRDSKLSNGHRLHVKEEV